MGFELLQTLLFISSSSLLSASAHSYTFCHLIGCGKIAESSWNFNTASYGRFARFQVKSDQNAWEGKCSLSSGSVQWHTPPKYKAHTTLQKYFKIVPNCSGNQVTEKEKEWATGRCSLRDRRGSCTAPHDRNERRPNPSRATARDLSQEKVGDWDKTKGNGHINYMHSWGGSYYQRVKKGLRGRESEAQAETERERDGEIKRIMLTENPECLLREGMFVLSSKTPAGCWVMSQFH